MYIREAHAVLIVYDMTAYQTFEAVDTWFKMIDDHLDPSKVVVALIGNKCDHHEMISIKVQSIKEQAKKMNASLQMEVSAKDNINIDELFNKLAD